MLENIPQQSNESPWWKVERCALEAACGPKVIYQAVRSGHLRAARIGHGRGTLRVHRDWLQTYLESRATPVEVTR